MKPALDSRQKLLAALTAPLGDGIAGRLHLFQPVGFRTTMSFALRWLLFASATAYAALWLSADAGHPGADGDHAKLLSLNVWTAVYYSAAIILSGIAARQTLEIVARDILPHASDDFARAVHEDIRSRPALLLLFVLPGSYALIMLVAGLASMRLEIPAIIWPPGRFPLDLLLFATSSFFLYFNGARAVSKAAYLLSFSRALQCHTTSLYVFGAADSPLVRGLSGLGFGALKYLTAIFLSIASIMTLVLLPSPYGFSEASVFLFILIPVAGFSSVGLGSVIYLVSESTIRTALKRFTLAKAKAMQGEINDLVERRARLSNEELAALERLTGWQDRILAGGRYGSRFGTGLSLALPLLMPAISALKSLLQSPLR